MRAHAERLSITKIGELAFEGRVRRWCGATGYVARQERKGRRGRQHQTDQGETQDARLHARRRLFTVSFLLRSSWAWPSP